MLKKKIIFKGREIELLEFVPDIYCNISYIANEMLHKLRTGILTWVTQETFSKMNVSIWVYESDSINAFAKHESPHNYIAISTGLLLKFLYTARDFVNHENFHVLFKLSDQNKSPFIDSLYLFMLNFIIAHEFGHIAHGHLLVNSTNNTISEMANIDETHSKESNWLTQMKEFDADSFAVGINFILFFQTLDTNVKTIYANFDLLVLSTYLTFQTLAENSNRDFSQYMNTDIDDFDHPHPGIRMFYSLMFFADWIISNQLDTQLLMYGTHAIIAYDRQVLSKERFSNCFYSIGQTEKGVNHVKALSNGWRRLVSTYNRQSYVHIRKMDFIDQIPFSIDENGDFLPINNL